MADNSPLEEEEEEPLSFTPISWNEDDFKERKGTDTAVGFECFHLLLF